MMKIALALVVALAATLANAQTTIVLKNQLPQIDFQGMEPAVVSQFEAALQLFQSELAEAQTSNVNLSIVYGELGELFHAYEFLDQALWSYERALVARPEDFEHAYLAAVANEALGRFPTAIARYQAALLVQPEHAPSLLNLAAIMRKQGEPNLAGMIMDRAPAGWEKQASWLAALAEQAQATGDLPAAIELLEQAIKFQPSANRLYYQLGIAHKQLGDEAAARAALAASGPVGVKAVDPILDRVNALAAGEIANLLAGRRAFAAGDYAAAAAAFGKAVDANRNSIAGRVNLGTTLVQLGYYADAAQQFNAVLKVQPANLAAIYNLGAINELTGEDKNALVWYARALSYNPNDLEIHYRMGLLLRRQGQDQEAFQHLAAARQDQRYFADAVFGMASIATQAQDYQTAIEILNQAHATMPDDRRVALALAKLLAASPTVGLRDGNAALELAQAVNKVSADAESAEMTALALAELGRCKAAASWAMDAHRYAGDDNPESVRLALLAESYQTAADCRP